MGCTLQLVGGFGLPAVAPDSRLWCWVCGRAAWVVEALARYARPPRRRIYVADVEIPNAGWFSGVVPAAWCGLHRSLDRPTVIATAVVRNWSAGQTNQTGGAESHPNTLTGNDANTLAPSVGQHVPTAWAKPGVAAGPPCLTVW